MHQLLPPLLSIILTVPLGPHPPQPASSSQPSPTEIRSRASDVLSKIASTYSPSYPGLIPRLVMTLTKALHSPPFPSPLGAANPPTGRYEGAILGLGGLGPQAVREGIWGEKGEGVRRIDELAGRLYSEAGKRKNPLVRATIVSLISLFPFSLTLHSHLNPTDPPLFFAYSPRPTASSFIESSRANNSPETKQHPNSIPQRRTNHRNVWTQHCSRAE